MRPIEQTPQYSATHCYADSVLGRLQNGIGFVPGVIVTENSPRQRVDRAL